MNGLFDLSGFNLTGNQGGNLSNFFDWGGATGSGIASNVASGLTNLGTNTATNAATDAATNVGNGMFGSIGNFLNSDAFKLMAALGMTGLNWGQQQNNYKDQMKFAKTALNQGQKNWRETTENNKAIADRENERFTKVVRQDANGNYYVDDATSTPDINWA